MYSTFSFGPLSLPTSPFLTLLAVMLGMDIFSRYGERLGLDADDTWNLSLWAILTGLIVARLWNVVQFWGVYQSQPLLIFSPRPSGFIVMPGLIAALIVAYGYMIYRALPPMRIAAAAVMGGLFVSAVLSLSAFLTGTLIGTESTLPWAMSYYGEYQHPVGVYRAIGFLLVLVTVWLISQPKSPATDPRQTILLGGLGYSLVHLIADAFVADAFVADAALMGTVRWSQLIGFAGALLCLLLLSLRQQTQISASAPA
ncbi:MAG: prolipoprotein diacylglyceryl transferase family protein [Chloroflexota bacterium]